MQRLNVSFFSSEAEFTSGIVCCCLPVLPQFYRTHVSGFVTSLRGRLLSYTAGTVIGPKSYSGDSSGTRELKNIVDGRFPRPVQVHTSEDLNRPLVKQMT